ncbi:ras-related protein Rab-3B isoform X3 [Haliaeetus albicilla]|uniref:ras-related protein Rab-3B isoform X3 n=1 Tax=Haliaeetus albicilla TaxID=8969 RepID=UPI0037E89594
MKPTYANFSSLSISLVCKSTLKRKVSEVPCLKRHAATELQGTTSKVCVCWGRLRPLISDQILDTAGQERYRTITTAYYRGAMGFVLMYDITSEDSFNAVQDWATQIKTYSWDNAQVILVGNKCDMEDERIVPVEKGKHLADQLGFDYFEASAKENINVRQVFERLVDIICEKMSESIESDPSRGTSGRSMRLTDNPPPSQQNCSC